VDTKYVNELKTRIERKGDMDPVLIVKLVATTINPPTRGRTDQYKEWTVVDGMPRLTEWIVVDGHHRLAAYRKLKRTDPIKCEWFAGSVREAMDESLRRNEKIHLRIDQGDKAEAAWTRTLLDWNGEDWRRSKKDVVELTGCGEGSVAHMRRVMKWHYRHVTGQEQTPMGEKLEIALGRDLREHSWNKVKEAALGLTPQQQDENKAAANLSRNLTTRMTDTLSRDPEVTAHALWLYNRDMCQTLVEELQKRIKKETKEETKEETKDERALEDQAADEKLEGLQEPTLALPR
jgi:hypothetical protein